MYIINRNRKRVTIHLPIFYLSNVFFCFVDYWKFLGQCLMQLWSKFITNEVLNIKSEVKIVYAKQLIFVYINSICKIIEISKHFLVENFPFISTFFQEHQNILYPSLLPIIIFVNYYKLQYNQITPVSVTSVKRKSQQSIQ